MEIYFEIEPGHLLMELPTDEDAPMSKLELTPKLKQEMALKRTIGWKIAGVSTFSKYKAGDEVILLPEASGRILELPLPTSEGQKIYACVIEDYVLGKILVVENLKHSGGLINSIDESI